MVPENTSPATPAGQDWRSLHVLAEPTRRRVFEAVRSSSAPMTRDAVAEATGINRRLATFHLDQLAFAGLLDVHYARPPGRGGPGAGRPAKRYAAVGGELNVSVPARRYDLLARILAAGIRDSAGGDPTESTRAAAVAAGVRIGELRRPARQLSRRATFSHAKRALADLGYEPAQQGQPVLLHNCPFGTVAAAAPRVVCVVNQCFISGVLQGLRGAADVTAELRSEPPSCCVRLVVTASRPDPDRGSARGRRHAGWR